MSEGLRDGLRKRIEKVRTLPSSPAVLKPLLELLRLEPEEINLKKVVELVSYDKTIAAQCLRIANSPLYGRARGTESIQAAIVTLGIQRVEDILLTCCLHKFSAGSNWATDPEVYWRHSLGCATVCRELAERIDFRDPDKAYLAGLLHDLGILVNSLAYPGEYKAVVAEARERGVPLAEQEMKDLGFTHAESGSILGTTWQLPPAIIEVIAFHHDVERAPADNPLVALVHIGDLLCRYRGLGYGYEEWRSVELASDPAWEQLMKYGPRLASMDLARFTMDLDAFLPKVQHLVDAVFSSKVEQAGVEISG
jgi:HD-like signal output (HDOD) protein